MKIRKDIEALHSEMTEWRRHLHAHPETAFEEHETAAFISEKLTTFGLEVHTGMAETGVVATLTRGSGEAIGLRSDIDALNMEEQNDFDHASKNRGKMHACGHDGHTAMLLGAAKYLSEKGRFNGTIHFIFQPAEEGDAGGRVMVEEGLFDTFPVNSVYGLHNFPLLPVGTFAIRKGPMMASYDTFDINIKGVGGHAAMPHMCKDPVLGGAQLVNLLQSIASRNINPTESCVVSVTEFHGGTAYNVIPEEVILRGCTRSFAEPVQAALEDRMKEISAGLATSMDLKLDVAYRRLYPPTVNSEAESDLAIAAAAAVSGDDKVITTLPPIMGSEDFAFMLQEKPGAYMGIGAGTPRENGMLHQPGYDFNDEILPLGTAYWVTLAEKILG